MDSASGLQMMLYTMEHYREEDTNIERLLHYYEHQYRPTFGKLDNLLNFLIRYRIVHSCLSGENLPCLIYIGTHLGQLDKILVDLQLPGSPFRELVESDIIVEDPEEVAKALQNTKSIWEGLKSKILQKDRELEEEAAAGEERKHALEDMESARVMQTMLYSLDIFREEDNNIEGLLHFYEHQYRPANGKMDNLLNFLTSYSNFHGWLSGDNVPYFDYIGTHLERMDKMMADLQLPGSPFRELIESSLIMEDPEEVAKALQTTKSRWEGLESKILQKDRELEEAAAGEEQKPTPAAEEQEEGVRPAAAEEQKEQEEEEGAPAEEDPALAEEADPAPAAKEDPAPAAEEDPTPAAEDPTPAAKDPALKVEEDLAPAEEEDTAPAAEEDINPAAVEDAAPVAKDTTPTLCKRVRKAIVKRLQRIWHSTRRLTCGCRRPTTAP